MSSNEMENWGKEKGWFFTAASAVEWEADMREL
jgi:hypothetical protein